MITTVGQAWRCIDEIALELGRSKPETEAEIKSLGAEATSLYLRINEAASKMTLVSLGGID